MKTWPKKLVTIITEKILEAELIEHLKKMNVKGLTITDARGEGARGTRSSSWEQTANIRLEIVCDEELAEAVCLSLRERFYDDYAMIAFVTDVGTFRKEKF